MFVFLYLFITQYSTYCIVGMTVGVVHEEINVKSSL